MKNSLLNGKHLIEPAKKTVDQVKFEFSQVEFTMVCLYPGYHSLMG
jgi:hypothetical protein